MRRPIIITLLIAALLLVLGGIGAVIFFTVRGGNFFKEGNQPFATLEESKTVKIDAESPVTLKVIDDAGSVTIVGADVKTIEVKVVKIAHARTQAQAEEEVKTIKYDIDQAGNAITLKYELPKTTVFDQNFKTVDFVVTVPNETTVNINNNLGDVSVTSIKGSTVIASDFGEVKVDTIEGALSVSNNTGEVTAASIQAGSEDIELNSDFGAITLKNASGNDITLDSNSGTITLREVRATGNINTKTDFGDTSVENGSANSLSVETNSGAVTLKKVRISKEIKVQDDFGEIELEGALANSYDLHTNSGSVTVDGAQGNLKAHTEFGGIIVQNAESVTLDLKTNSGTVDFSGSLAKGPHTIESDFGEINLTLPADSKLSVDLKTEFGNISSDLPITVLLNRTSNSNSDQIVGSINGGGEQLTVQTKSGGVNIEVSK
jgi:DUF4097 and DUF4098 domain-containing protein YvlB